MTAAELAALALRWRAAGRAAVVVSVERHQGSVPRETGTRMLVAADEVQGTIGGGHLELQAIDDARALLARGGAPVQLRVPLGPALGQCCGGVVHLRVAPLAGDDPASWQLPAPRFVLRLYGAGHVGRAIVRLLADIDCRVHWVDEREAEFPAGPLPPHVERLCVEPVDAEVRAAAAGDFHLVLTHSHDLDLALARAILERGDFGWFGLIGSATKRARFEARLAERGIAPERLARLVCPIGLPGIEGKEPAVIALAVVAQMLQAAGAAPAARSA